jgi:hypothetical protein
MTVAPGLVSNPLFNMLKVSLLRMAGSIQSNGVSSGIVEYCTEYCGKLSCGSSRWQFGLMVFGEQGGESSFCNCWFSIVGVDGVAAGSSGMVEKFEEISSAAAGICCVW